MNPIQEFIKRYQSIQGMAHEREREIRIPNWLTDELANLGGRAVFVKFRVQTLARRILLGNRLALQHIAFRQIGFDRRRNTCPSTFVDMNKNKFVFMTYNHLATNFYEICLSPKQPNQSNEPQLQRLRFNLVVFEAASRSHQSPFQLSGFRIRSDYHGGRSDGNLPIIGPVLADDEAVLEI